MVLQWRWLRASSYLGQKITNNLTWTTHTDETAKKTPYHLNFLRRLNTFGMSPMTCTNDLYQFLQKHCRKHSIRMHYSLLWQLLCWKPQVTAENCECSPVNRVSRASHPSTKSEFHSASGKQPTQSMSTHNPVIPSSPLCCCTEGIKADTIKFKNSFFPIRNQTLEQISRFELYLIES